MLRSVISCSCFPVLFDQLLSFFSTVLIRLFLWINIDTLRNRCPVCWHGWSLGFWVDLEGDYDGLCNGWWRFSPSAQAHNRFTSSGILWVQIPLQGKTSKQARGFSIPDVSCGLIFFFSCWHYTLMISISIYISYVFCFTFQIPKLPDIDPVLQKNAQIACSVMDRVPISELAGWRFGYRSVYFTFFYRENSLL